VWNPSRRKNRFATCRCRVGARSAYTGDQILEVSNFHEMSAPETHPRAISRHPTNPARLPSGTQDKVCSAEHWMSQCSAVVLGAGFRHLSPEPVVRGSVHTKGSSGPTKGPRSPLLLFGLSVVKTKAGRHILAHLGLRARALSYFGIFVGRFPGRPGPPKPPKSTISRRSKNHTFKT